MTIMQRDFLDNLAKLLKAYNVRSFDAVMNKICVIFQESDDSMQLTGYNGENGTFLEVMTMIDYKPTETELDAE